MGSTSSIKSSLNLVFVPFPVGRWSVWSNDEGNLTMLSFEFQVTLIFTDYTVLKLWSLMFEKVNLVNDGPVTMQIDSQPSK